MPAMYHQQVGVSRCEKEGPTKEDRRIYLLHTHGSAHHTPPPRPTPFLPPLRTSTWSDRRVCNVFLSLPHRFSNNDPPAATKTIAKTATTTAATSTTTISNRTGIRFCVEPHPSGDSTSATKHIGIESPAKGTQLSCSNLAPSIRRFPNANRNRTQPILLRQKLHCLLLQ